MIIQVQDGSQDIGHVERGNMEDSNEILIKKEFIPTMRMFLDDVVKDKLLNQFSEENLFNGNYPFRIHNVTLGSRLDINEYTGNLHPHFHVNYEGYLNQQYRILVATHIAKEIEKQNDKIIWTGIYEYDENNNLVSIKRKNQRNYENELFRYDKNKRLIEQSIKNEEILNENVSFSVKNNSTTYKYDKMGRQIEEITFNHKGKEHRHFTNKYELKE